MQVIEVQTDFAHIRSVALDRDKQDREWLYRHSLHQLIRAYRREFGDDAADHLMGELLAYHSPRVVIR